MIGARFGRWTIIAASDEIKSERKTWLCRCDCGTERSKNLSALKAGLSLSCGCYNREQSSKKHKRHGLSKSKIYGVWKNMRKRCYCKTSCDYYLYGARGITVCDSWLHFDNFYADMGDLPFVVAQLDRIDSNGNYCPENCKWSTPTENVRNRRDNRLIEFNGETRCMTEWEELLGMPRNMIYSRMKLGWDVNKTMTTPPQKRGMASKEGFEYNGKQHKWISRVPQKAVVL